MWKCLIYLDPQGGAKVALDVKKKKKKANCPAKEKFEQVNKM